MTARLETSDRATTFAHAMYMDAHDRATKYRNDALRRLHAEASRDGLIGSPALWKPAARLYANCIDEIVIAKVDSLLEARQINEMSVTDEDADDMIQKVMNHKDWLLQELRTDVPDVDRGLWTIEQFLGVVLTETEVSRATVFAHVERSRLTPRKGTGVEIHQHGHNSRVNMDSIDNSTNTVDISEDQVFVQMRERFATEVSVGPELTAILERLTALDAARGTPLFGQRFAELMTLAANSATILSTLTPYMHALGAMVQKWSG